MHEIFIDSSIFVGEFRIIPGYSRWICFLPVTQGETRGKMKLKTLHHEKRLLLKRFWAQQKRAHSPAQLTSRWFFPVPPDDCLLFLCERVTTAASSSWECLILATVVVGLPAYYNLPCGCVVGCRRLSVSYHILVPGRIRVVVTKSLLYIARQILNFQILRKHMHACIHITWYRVVLLCY